MLRFFIYIFCFLTLSACSSTQQLGATLPFKTGNTLTYKMTQNVVTEVDVMGIPQKVNGVQGATYEYNVKNVSPQGEVTMDVTTKAINMEQVTPMMTIRYDSENPEKNEPKEALAAMDNMIGFTYNVKMDKAGKIIEAKGGDELAKKMGGDGAQMQELIKSQFDLGGSVYPLVNFYPDKVVKVGDSWMRTDTIRSQVAMLAKNTFTLQERSGGKAIIAFKGDLTSLEGAGMEMQGMKLSYELSGTSEGKIIVDDKTGIMDTSERKMKVDGEMKMAGGPMGNMAANMKFVIDNSFTKIEN